MIFIDTNIFMYAAGKESSQRLPCQAFLKKVVEAKGKDIYCTNVEVLQEILHRYKSINTTEVGLKIFDSITCLGISILPIDLDSMHKARNLIEEFPRLGARDCVHLGFMQNQKISKMVSFDQDFSNISWLERIEP